MLCFLLWVYVCVSLRARAVRVCERERERAAAQPSKMAHIESELSDI